MGVKDLMGLGVGAYEVRTKCTKCKNNKLTKIKKGNKAEEVIANGKCAKCGCMTLELVK